MTFQEIEFALKVNGVDKEDMQTLMGYCKTKGTDYSKLDEMLVEMGYDRVFTDEFFGWADGDDEYYDEDEDFDQEYFSTERNPHKHKWEE
jgi:hypothetical protein